MAVEVSKQDYLKRYMSDAESGKKKKKKRSKVDGKLKKSNFQIIDDDAFVPASGAKPEEIDIEDDEEFAEPEIKILSSVTIDELKMMGKFKTATWSAETQAEIKREIKDEPLDSDADDGPQPKRGRHDLDNDHESNVRSSRVRHDSEDDASPVRRVLYSDSHNNNHASPVRTARHDSDDDQSPVRQTGSESQNESITSKQSHDNHVPSTSRKTQSKGGGDSDDDLSPPRKSSTTTLDDDLSPPRRSSNKSPDNFKMKVQGKMRKTLSGAVAGLQSASALRDEASKLKKLEEDKFDKLDDNLSGRNAETQLRAGRRAKHDAKIKDEEEKKKLKEELTKKYDKWNKGVKQLQERDSDLNSMAKEVNKPLARYEGDEDLEEYLRQQDRANEDPMYKYMANKKNTKAIKQGKKIYPTYNGPLPAPNRFNIMPGFRWDGVDRSNGFEAKLFETKNTKKAENDELYRYQAGSYE